jgi:hypothetical protein
MWILDAKMELKSGRESSWVEFYLPAPQLSIRLATFTVFPNRQYRGILVPTMPAPKKSENAANKTNDDQWEKFTAGSRVYSNSNFQFFICRMRYFEAARGVQQIQSHGCDFTDMLFICRPLRKTRCNLEWNFNSNIWRRREIDDDGDAAHTH